MGLTTNGTYNGDASGSTVTRSGMQWLKLQISADNTSLSLADHGRIFDPSSSAWCYYFPSLMVTARAYGQGDIALDYSGNTSGNPFATDNGLFWLSTGGTPVLINQDFNAAFYVGAASNNLPLLRTFLLKVAWKTGALL